MRLSYLPMVLLAALAWVAVAPPARAAGGPLGIDHRLHYDNSGIWKRSYQKDLIYVMAAGIGGTALWEGGNTRLGKTSWQAIDSTAMAAVSAQLLKFAFTRARPSQTSDPNQWFQGGSHYSFPSGEVTAVAAMVTPYILEYRHTDPWVYGLEVLPAYDAVARMKVHGHWQTDVLAGFLLGTAMGYVAHSFKEPISLSILPGGFSVGLHERF